MGESTTSEDLRVLVLTSEGRIDLARMAARMKAADPDHWGQVTDGKNDWWRVPIQSAAAITDGTNSPPPGLEEHFAGGVDSWHLFQLCRDMKGSRTPGNEAVAAERLKVYALIFLDYLDAKFVDHPINRSAWDDDDVMALFVQTWHRVHFGTGMSLQSECMRKANTHPLRVKQLRGKQLTILSYAYYLQLFQGEKPILLPLANIADMLGCAKQAVSAHVNALCRTPWLEVISDTAKQGTAKTYKFKLDTLTSTQKPAKTK